MLVPFDNNNNASLEQKEMRDGRKCWKVQWSKRSQSFVNKAESKSKDYSFCDDLMNFTVAYLNQIKCGTDTGSATFRQSSDDVSYL